MCSGDILLEIVEPGIVDKNVAALVLVANPRAEGGYTGFVGEGQLSRTDLHGWGNRQATQVNRVPRTRGCVQNQGTWKLLNQRSTDGTADASVLEIWSKVTCCKSRRLTAPVTMATRGVSMVKNSLSRGKEVNIGTMLVAL